MGDEIGVPATAGSQIRGFPVGRREGNEGVMQGRRLLCPKTGRKISVRRHLANAVPPCRTMAAAPIFRII